MEATYKLKANEVDMKLVNAIRDFFKDEQITIKISSEMDETEYLLFNESNRLHLEANMKSSEIKKFSGNEFNEFIKEKFE
jgi:hypothetical protein